MNYKNESNYHGYYSWFRTEPMSLCQLILQTESAYSIVSLLGEEGLCQFRDLNPHINAFQKKFVNEIRRCIDMERKLSFFETEIRRDLVPVLDYDQEPPAPSIREITQLEAQLEKLETDLTNVNSNRLSLKRKLLELIEMRHILKKSQEFFEQAVQGQQSNLMRRLSMAEPQLARRFSVQLSGQLSGHEGNIPLDPVVDIYTYTGTILASRFLSFERMLWRISRGNILLKRIEIEEVLEDPESGELHHKCLFILVFQGEKLKATCEKICEGFRTSLYPCPDKSEERKKMLAGVVLQIEDMLVVIKQSDDHRSRILVALAKNLMSWKVSVAKMRSIYETMNFFSFDITAKCLIAEAWLPRAKIDLAKQALVKGKTLSNSNISSVLSVLSSEETPPTLNVTNKFTEGFQTIIDSYGVSDYREVNPAPFAIISFPFIFAVMFGDLGHGIIMTLFALFLVFKENQLAQVKDEIFSMFFGGRYIILLMGAFSMYTGAIYNDIFAKSMNIFGSQYHPPILPSNETAYPEHGLMLLPNSTYSHPGYIYPFGLDPVWQLSTNKVLYLNTFKMKLSVILGVIQMLGGVILSAFNHVHFGHVSGVVLEFIPQVVFLLAIFGYMNFMIFFKWFQYTWADSNCAPSILITLINMFMMKAPADTDPCYLKDEMYPGQFTVQTVLLLLALLCVPWMLLIKPFTDKRAAQNKARAKAAANARLVSVDASSGQSFEMKTKVNGSNSADDMAATTSRESNEPHAKEEEFQLGDAFITQAIHTIEYCLGSVSHTASYLRLWALSLAHAQLSEVLWNMVMKNAFMFAKDSETSNQIIGAVVTFFVFAFWATLTVAILIMMEGLSAFLHALRLHWVEFMSKFYHGSGYAFAPFAFKTIIAEL